MIAPAPPQNVRAVFDAMPPKERAALMSLRRLIFETAADLPKVGPLEECLKWGQPAYLTSTTKSGSTLRLGLPKQGGVAIYVHCQTSIISDVRAVFGKAFHYDGNRAVLLSPDADLPLDKLRFLVIRALTYHLR